EGGLEAGEGEVEGVGPEAGDGEVVGAVVGARGLGEAVEVGAAGVREAENGRGLVEGLAGRLVDRRAPAGQVDGRFAAVEGGVAAGDDEAEGWEERRSDGATQRRSRSGTGIGWGGRRVTIGLSRHGRLRYCVAVSLCRSAQQPRIQVRMDVI